ncbi:nucleoside 2-deoxyribosyltransferase domain-containing protein [Flavilitoribacter nigricans]|uniref:Nucleoside 2-deoxyribosyltransferase like n=1 Tax=Flavilitoribacter nigricans (strain ATCC 23147 / DSM 23189 / NBRC 102662 / NCIMB 1420 / SS-2) TaxID=1122177 RepID=A0A2D0N3H8_FLAN2|nr:nucleoside 2-deoxyribosyltransferase domain-containing protein [Flavilitoribacter nigricans]PHN02938.1 hypothetical protein CRP01_29470 [Flavilitoribacter nigricans DSM 23189 = NBRC 102662]
MKIIKPPLSIAKHHRRPKSLFLAGSIEMGKSENWQAGVENYFADLEDYTLFNPRRDNWDASWEQEFEKPEFYQQVNWELTALEQADLILMYFSPETKSPISLLELGLHARSGKLLVCCPDGFWRKGNVEIVCERYTISTFFNDLEELLASRFPKG